MPVKKSDSKYVDVLDEDKPINGQKYACLSFISPEDILERREHFLFQKFVKHWDFAKSMEKFVQFINFASHKYDLVFDELVEDLKEFTESERDNLLKSDISSEYKTFLDEHEDALNEEFNKKNDFQTSVRGIKVRGVFATQQEAEMRCKMVREVDPNFDVYVGQVGVWVPFHPEAYKTGRVEYMEEELNQLMHEKMKNERTAKQEFDKRVKESRRNAIEENIKLAEENNNTLTQTLDEDGNLIGIKNLNTQEKTLNRGNEVTVEDVKRELFDGENIMPNKDGIRRHT